VREPEGRPALVSEGGLARLPSADAEPESRAFRPSSDRRHCRGADGRGGDFSLPRLACQGLRSPFLRERCSLARSASPSGFRGAPQRRLRSHGGANSRLACSRPSTAFCHSRAGPASPSLRRNRAGRPSSPTGCCHLAHSRSLYVTGRAGHARADRANHTRRPLAGTTVGGVEGRESTRGGRPINENRRPPQIRAGARLLGLGAPCSAADRA